MTEEAGLARGDAAGFAERMSQQSLAPLWEVLRALDRSGPKSRAAAAQWRYADVKPVLMETADLISAEEAERRVLILENPAMPRQGRTTSTLYAGLQLLLPGESAAAHRHSPSALRFMIEGQGVFTAVDGERTTMKPGDFIITPAWTFHDHGNEGSEPCIWLDGLDNPITGFFETVFFEDHNDSHQLLSRPEGDSLARFGSGLLPLDDRNPHGLTSPIFNYPYSRTREALLTCSRGEIDAHSAVSLRYSNPLDGGWAMPTIATWVMYIPKGFETAPMRSTDGIIFTAVEGSGQVTCGDQNLTFGPRDVQALPGWTWRRFRADEDTVLFLYSDRAAQEKLGFYREEKRPA